VKDCINCGEELPVGRPKYCSEKCNKEYNHTLNEVGDRYCEGCGNLIIGSGYRFCCPECRSHNLKIKNRICVNCGGILDRGWKFCSEQCKYDYNEKYSPIVDGPERCRILLDFKPQSRQSPCYDDYKSRIREKLAYDGVKMMRSTIPLFADIKIHVMPQNRIDIDNYLKGLFDAIKGIVFYDDVQIKKVHVDILEDSPFYLVDISIKNKRLK
jgi:Holliday junction resolvase RusA-like endonuclease/predicted nucleic acid-binding Zn ribbon protein